MTITKERLLCSCPGCHSCGRFFIDTFGLLSQISPDGRYAVSKAKDRSLVVPKPDFYFSRLFLSLKGILAYYSTING